MFNQSQLNEPQSEIERWSSWVKSMKSPTMYVSLELHSNLKINFLT